VIPGGAGRQGSLPVGGDRDSAVGDALEAFARFGSDLYESTQAKSGDREYFA